MARDENVPLCYKGSMPLLNDLLMETTLEKISPQEKTWPEAMPYNRAKKPYKGLLGMWQRLNPLCETPRQLWAGCEELYTDTRYTPVEMSTC